MPPTHGAVSRETAASSHVWVPRFWCRPAIPLARAKPASMQSRRFHVKPGAIAEWFRASAAGVRPDALRFRSWGRGEITSVRRSSIGRGSPASLGSESPLGAQGANGSLESRRPRNAALPHRWLIRDTSAHQPLRKRLARKWSRLGLWSRGHVFALSTVNATASPGLATNGGSMERRTPRRRVTGAARRVII